MRQLRASRLFAVPAMLSLLCLGSLPATAGPSGPQTAEELKESILQRASAAASGSASAPALRSLAAASALETVGNGIFQVAVEQNLGLGVGTFTVLTGPGNPAGAGLDVLFGGGIPGTSYMIIRDVDSGIDYVQGQLLTHPNEMSLDDYFPQVTPLGSTGFRTSWYFGWITQDVVVHGTTQADSSVEVTTRITGDREYRIQYLWDVALGEDDGPVLQPQQATTQYRPFGTVVTHEYTLGDGEDSLTVADNDANAAPLNFAIGVTATGPSRISPVPTPPSSVKYVCWPHAIFAALGAYHTDPTLDVSTPAASCTGPSGGDDSAILSLWDADGSAGPVEVSASLFMSPQAPHPTALTATPVLLRLPAFSATLTDTAAGQRVQGRTIAFRVGNTVRCTAVTNANGVATCGTLADGLAATLALGYTASYAGSAVWSPSTARGRLL